ncbi:hypothetical protein F1880_006040 [Penicillium rolfsii]|nr:hypothetical protein F1880_006040 [Penicillium rolfsii]
MIFANALAQVMSESLFGGDVQHSSAVEELNKSRPKVSNSPGIQTSSNSAPRRPRDPEINPPAFRSATGHKSSMMQAPTGYPGPGLLSTWYGTRST